MSDSGSQFDWDGVFDRAHRRLYVRLVLLSLVGGLAALLLLGGGLSTRGDLTWNIGPFASKTSKKKKEGKVKVGKKVKEALSPPPIARPSSEPLPNNPPPERKAKPNVPIVIPVPPPEPEPEPCPKGDSSSKEYEDCLPQPTPINDGTTGPSGAAGVPSSNESGGTQNGGTEYVEGTATDQGGGLSNATSEGAAAN